MKHVACLTLLVFGGPALSLAGSCGAGTLASYVSLGAAGCTIGSNTLSDFSIPASGTARATELNPTTIDLQPFGGSANPGLMVTVTASAGTNQILEGLFTYSISGNIYGADSITLSNSSETADGAVSYSQNFCPGGAFGTGGFGGCGTTPGSLVTLDGVQNQDSISFPGVGLLGVTDDLVLDGGLAGSASGAVFRDQFTAVPEPGTGRFLLTLIGLAVGVCLIRRGRIWSVREGGKP